MCNYCRHIMYVHVPRIWLKPKCLIRKQTCSNIIKKTCVIVSLILKQQKEEEEKGFK